jgi:uncharacterized ion transporter superfamily protein YfcC
MSFPQTGVADPTTTATPTIKPWYLRVPDPMVLIFSILVIASILTHFIPAGEFARETIDGMTKIVPGSYQTITGQPTSFFDVFVAVPLGLINAAPYLFIVFIAGGLFHLLKVTHALENLVGTAVHKVGTHNKPLVIIATTYIFGFFGIAVGFENNIALVPIAILVGRALGGSNMLGVGMAVGGIGAGFALSPINPYTIGVSQKIAELPLFSGAGLRWALVLSALMIVALYMIRYDRKHGKSNDTTGGAQLSKALHEYSMNAQDYRVMGIFLAGLALMLWGVFTKGWYINEIAACFLMIAIAVGIACKMNGDTIVKHMMDGASTVVPGALVIGLAASIQVVLKDAQVIDTVVYGMSNMLHGMPDVVSAISMSVAQGFLNFFIPGGSGQALVTMPVLIPLSDMIGVSRQVTILAFQVGDGLTNLIVPTSGGTLAMLALGGVSYERWLKMVLPLVGTLYLLAWAFITFAVLTGYQ